MCNYHSPSPIRAFIRFSKKGLLSSTIRDCSVTQLSVRDDFKHHRWHRDRKVCLFITFSFCYLEDFDLTHNICLSFFLAWTLIVVCSVYSHLFSSHHLISHYNQLSPIMHPEPSATKSPHPSAPNALNTLVSNPISSSSKPAPAPTPPSTSA